MARLTTPPLFAQNVYGLSEDDIWEATPAVFTETPHPDCSKKFTPFSTINLLHRLADEAGFIPTMVMQAPTRREGYENFGRHVARVRHQDDLGNNKPDTYEILIFNGNDTRTAIKATAGWIRSFCMNGGVWGETDASLKVYHMGNIVEQVIESTLTIAKKSGEIMGRIETMKEINLNQAEQLLLAERFLQARFDPPKDEEEDEDDEEEDEEQQQGTERVCSKSREKKRQQMVLYHPEDLLQHKRWQDKGNSLYLTYNKGQEWLLRGGIQARYPNAKGHYLKMRAVTSISESFHLNRRVTMLSQDALTLKRQGRSLEELFVRK